MVRRLSVLFSFAVITASCAAGGTDIVNSPEAATAGPTIANPVAGAPQDIEAVGLGAPAVDAEPASPSADRLFDGQDSFDGVFSTGNAPTAEAPKSPGAISTALDAPVLDDKDKSKNPTPKRNTKPRPSKKNEPRNPQPNPTTTTVPDTTPTGTTTTTTTSTPGTTTTTTPTTTTTTTSTPGTTTTTSTPGTTTTTTTSTPGTTTTTTVPTSTEAAPAFCNRGLDLPYRGDILPYLRSDVDVVVPPGRYSIGAINDLGRTHLIQEDRDEWVTVKAETPGTVVVDGSYNHSGVKFDGSGFGSNQPSQRLIIAGIHWTATSVQLHSTQDVSFWYTCHEYTPRQWHENAMASAAANGVTIPATGPKDPHGDGGGLYALSPDGAAWSTIANGMGAYNPTGLRVSGSNGATRNMRFFGVDVGPVGDDGIYLGSAWNTVIEGARIQQVTEMYWQPDGDGVSVDPGPVYGNEGDQFHNDGIQIGKSGWRPTIIDTWSSGRIMFNREPHAVKTDWGLRVRRSWFGPSEAPNTGGSDQVANLTDDPRFADWLLGNEGGPFPALPIAVIVSTSSAVEKMSAEFTDVTHIVQPGRSYFATHVNGQTLPPSSFPNLTMTNMSRTNLGLGDRDIYTSFDAIALHPQNPANIWRADHPYSEVSTYPGLTASSYRPE